jgi:hypothetical protein
MRRVGNPDSLQACRASRRRCEMNSMDAVFYIVKPYGYGSTRADRTTMHRSMALRFNGLQAIALP